jgi:hypothetical protein
VGGWGVRKTTSGAKKAIGGITSEKLDGRSVSDEKLMKAAKVQVEYELKHPGKKLGALTLAKAIGMTTAPEWLDSTRYGHVLEIIRFESKVKELQARPEIASTISELISLGLLEAQRRLILNPSEIPATVLYGDILHKFPKMLHDFNQNTGPVKTGDVFQTIVYEINMIQDVPTRERLRKQLIGRLNDAATALNTAVPEAVNVDSGTVDDGSVLIVDESTELVSTNGSAENLSGGILDPRMWDDPALD